jgi:TatD DNase family protein
MIDTHCHLTFRGLHDRLDAVLSEAAQAGVDRMICVGTTPDDARQAHALAQGHDNIYATVGLHPLHVDECDDRAALEAAMHELADQPKIVALGEMGLDQHYDEPPLADQRERFQWQLELAGQYPNKPIVIHNRKATDETLAMLRQANLPGERFVFHCFTGEADEAKQILEFGAMISVTGIVTFKNAKQIAQAIDEVPWDRLMIETDAPFLTPEPYRKVRPNEPRYVADVARFLAKRYGISESALIQQMDANAERFFQLPPASD